jgi:hypothetical protein
MAVKSRFDPPEATELKVELAEALEPEGEDTGESSTA